MHACANQFPPASVACCLRSEGDHNHRHLVSVDHSSKSLATTVDTLVLNVLMSLNLIVIHCIFILINFVLRNHAICVWSFDKHDELALDEVTHALWWWDDDWGRSYFTDNPSSRPTMLPVTAHPTSYPSLAPTTCEPSSEFPSFSPTGLSSASLSAPPSSNGAEGNINVSFNSTLAIQCIASFGVVWAVLHGGFKIKEGVREIKMLQEQVKCLKNATHIRCNALEYEEAIDIIDEELSAIQPLATNTTKSDYLMERRYSL